jgi:hypothetical protein
VNLTPTVTTRPEPLLAELEAFKAGYAEAQLEKARSYFPDYCEYVAQDEQGKSWKFAPHQYEWSELMDDTGVKLLLMVGPRGSAKSTTLQNRICWEVGRDPNLCVKYVCGNDAKAVDRLNFFRRNFVQNDRFHEVFPHIRPAGLAEWTKHKLTVERSAAAGLQDATIEAASVGSGGTGGRCHLLILDDIIDATDAYGTPAFMARTKRFIENDWFPTLFPGGRVWMIGTFWCFDPPDLYVEYSMDSGWTRWVKPACSIDENGRLCGPVLWEDRWPLQELEVRRRQVKDAAFYQQYLLRGATQRSQLFDSDTVNACKSLFTLLGEVPDGRQVVRIGIGLDPATSRQEGGSRSCIFTSATLDNGDKVPLSIIPGRVDPLVLTHGVLQEYRSCLDRFGVPTRILVENNATQETFATLIQLLAPQYGMSDIPIDCRHTGKQKWSPEVGLPALNAELIQRLWRIPFGGAHEEPFHSCPVCEWLNEMIFWGKTHDLNGKRVTKDTIMAWWLSWTAMEDRNSFGDIPVIGGASMREVRFGMQRRIA